MKTTFVNDMKYPIRFRGKGLNEGIIIMPLECREVEIGSFFKMWDYTHELKEYVILTK